ncbi:thiol:disulfide interchange protein DsbA/DsbL [Shewanella sp. NIFS-20-20]|uniref:thiol:disulfide interchange protein DsbA/DsbL n=1 Tax=Shewanella sp. NIFS-20-20 TaxID=2853806 RepID=UPI001C45FBAE|nr:thiol:disulfide interchange protein DsbA/DsbL [Shewanella sp. NIFS-20-20]MBV7315844.1 thiol:disulfide interchange protein DsbA/DsbL [Shewanella sp. NIFS-20-20]
MIKKLALALTLAISPLATYAADFVEGTHYTQITNQPASAEPKLTEFFSFYCHNCFAFETQYMPVIKPRLDKSIQFETKHVDFMNSEIGTEVMRALAVIHQLDQSEKLNIAMFNAIQGEDAANGHDHSAPGHKHEPSITSRDDIKKVFAEHGISASQYDALADNAITNEKLALWRAEQNKFKIQSVPAFIVNDKYAVNLGQMRTLSEMVELINYLSTKK